MSIPAEGIEGVTNQEVDEFLAERRGDNDLDPRTPLNWHKKYLMATAALAAEQQAHAVTRRELDELPVTDPLAQMTEENENFTTYEDSHEAWLRTGADLRVAETRMEVLRSALLDIVHASRDEGLATMCNWMRGRALSALKTDDQMASDV